MKKESFKDKIATNLINLEDPNWTLFLDRDGVINKRLPGRYVRHWEEFEFCKGSLAAIVKLRKHFARIVVVTNQQGIGKKIMTEKMLEKVHRRLRKEVAAAGGNLDQIYHCPGLAKENPPCRKPNPGMGLQAQKDFPEINFAKSIIVGDSISDIEFGIGLGMMTVFITTKEEEQEASQSIAIDHRFGSLQMFADWLVDQKS